MILPLESDIIAIKLVPEIFERGDQIFLFFFLRKPLNFCYTRVFYLITLKKCFNFQIWISNMLRWQFHIIYSSFFNQFLSLKNISTTCHFFLQAQDNLMHELRSHRFFDVFEYNGPRKIWGCFLCNHPDRAVDFVQVWNVYNFDI